MRKIINAELTVANQILYDANFSDNGEYLFFVQGIGLFNINTTYDGYILERSQQDDVGSISVKNIIYDF
jgi:hypothetical protein